MDAILSRIKDLVINEGITIGSLERRIGASKGVLSRAMKNGSDIQSKWLQTIASTYPQYSTKWLLTGAGNMLVETTIQEPIVAYEKSCPECKQYEQRIADLIENIGLLKDTISVQKELIFSLKNKFKVTDSKNSIHTVKGCSSRAAFAVLSRNTYLCSP